MDANKLISMLQTGYTTINVDFGTSAKVYTYKIPLDKDNTCPVSKGDFVVVNTSGLSNHKNDLDVLKVVQVTEVHDTPHISTNQYDYKWIVDIIDTKMYDNRVAVELKASKALTLLKAQRDQADALAKLGLTDEQLAAFKAMVNG